MQIDLSNIFQLFSAEAASITEDTLDTCTLKPVVEQARTAQADGRVYTVAFIRDVNGNDCLADAKALAQFFDVAGFVTPQTKVACAKVYLFVLSNQEQIFRPYTETAITSWPLSATMRNRLFNESSQELRLREKSVPVDTSLLFEQSAISSNTLVMEPTPKPSNNVTTVSGASSFELSPQQQVRTETAVQVQEKRASQEEQMPPQNTPTSQKDEVRYYYAQAKAGNINSDVAVRIAKQAAEFGMFEEAEKILDAAKPQTEDVKDLICYIKGIMPLEHRRGLFASITRGWCHINHGQIAKAAKQANNPLVQQSSEILVRWFRMIYAAVAKKKDVFKTEEKALFGALTKEKIPHHVKTCVDIYINLNIDDDLFDVITLFLDNFPDDVESCNVFLKKLEGHIQCEKTVEKIAKHLLSKEPENPLANYILAEIKRAAQGNKEEIKAHYAFAIACEDKRKAQIAENELAILSFREAKTEEQLLQIASQMEKLYTQNPTVPRSIALYGEWLIRSKKIEKTVALLNSIDAQTSMKQVAEHIARTLQETYPEEPLSYKWASKYVNGSLEQNLRISRKTYQFFPTLQHKIALAYLLLVTKTDQNIIEAERLLEEIIDGLDTFEVKNGQDEQAFFELLTLANYCKNYASKQAYALRVYEKIGNLPNVLDYCGPLATKLMCEATIESWGKVEMLLEPIEKKRKLRDKKELRQLYALALLSLYGLERYEEIWDVIPTVVPDAKATYIERLLFRITQFKKIEKRTKPNDFTELSSIQGAFTRMKMAGSVWSHFIEVMWKDIERVKTQKKISSQKSSTPTTSSEPQPSVPTERAAVAAVPVPVAAASTATAIAPAEESLGAVTTEQTDTANTLISLSTKI